MPRITCAPAARGWALPALGQLWIFIGKRELPGKQRVRTAQIRNPVHSSRAEPQPCSNWQVFNEQWNSLGWERCRHRKAAAPSPRQGTAHTRPEQLLCPGTRPRHLQGSSVQLPAAAAGAELGVLGMNRTMAGAQPLPRGIRRAQSRHCL